MNLNIIKSQGGIELSGLMGYLFDCEGNDIKFDCDSIILEEPTLSVFSNLERQLEKLGSSLLTKSDIKDLKTKSIYLIRRLKF